MSARVAKDLQRIIDSQAEGVWEFCIDCGCPSSLDRKAKVAITEAVYRAVNEVLGEAANLLGEQRAFVADGAIWQSAIEKQPAIRALESLQFDLRREGTVALTRAKGKQ